MEYVSGVIKKETKEISELVQPEMVGQTVKVNGAVETQRGKKLVAGDLVEFEGKQIRIEE